MRAWIYDKAIGPLTGKWYGSVLDHVGQNCHLLDVGIGTGVALVENAGLVRSKRLCITGVDIDRDYVKRAQLSMYKNDLVENVDVILESVYDHQGGPYDAVYFSASFMLMPDPARALKHVSALLKPGGRIFFTQTFQDRRSKFAERAKPLLKKLTTIEFGTVTYQEDFLAVLEDANQEVLELSTMARKGSRSYRLAITKRRGASA